MSTVGSACPASGVDLLLNGIVHGWLYSRSTQSSRWEVGVGMKMWVSRTINGIKYDSRHVKLRLTEPR